MLISSCIQYVKVSHCTQNHTNSTYFAGYIRPCMHIADSSQTFTIPILHLSLRPITVALGFPLDHENLVLFQKVCTFLFHSLLGPIRLSPFFSWGEFKSFYSPYLRVGWLCDSYRQHTMFSEDILREALPARDEQSFRSLSAYNLSAK